MAEMHTRRSSTTRIRELPGRYKFISKEKFPDKGMLPTKREVLQRMLHEENWRTKNAADAVAEELRAHWLWCNIYPISEPRIAQRLMELVKKFNFVDNYSVKKMGPAFERHLSDFLEDVDDLFDIFCRDDMQRRKQEKENKLRMNESDIAFYNDQRGERVRRCIDIVQNLSPTDINFKMRLSQQQVRDMASSSTVDNPDQPPTEGWDSESTASQSSTATASTSSEDFDQPAKKLKLNQQNRQSIKNLVMMCERFQLSDRAGAATGTATLKDFGIVTDTDTTYVIDRSKLRRERQKYREEIQEEEEKLFQMVDGIYIDGKKDATMVTTEHNGKIYRRTDLEEHYVIVGEPGEFYLSHVSPETGTGLQIADSIYQALKDTELEQTLNIIGSDGTASMTGSRKGCIASLESLLQRSLQWVICLLHCNELPLRHIFTYLDGTTKSPDSFSGVIGSKLNGPVSEWDVVSFKPIRNQNFPILPNNTIDELSSDQYYGYRICMAVMLGTVDEDLELLEVGGLSHARWLTLACRILRFYVSVQRPTPTLTTIVEFCIRVYFPAWFEIKHNHTITDGPNNFFNMLQRVVQFPNNKVKKIALDVLKRNAFFAHQENVLLGMLADDDETVRHLAVNKILSLRGVIEQFSIENEVPESEAAPVQNEPADGEESVASVHVRKFNVPAINVRAKSYYKLVNLNSDQTNEPPAIRHLTNLDIEKIREEKLIMRHPCHNQAVERHIKLVTEASSAVAGFNRRDGLIRLKIRSRKLMKRYNTKKQFQS